MIWNWRPFFLRAGPKSSCTTLYNLLFNPALKKKGCHILLVHSELLLFIKLESNQGTKFWKTDCSIINNIQFTSVTTSSSLKLSILHYVFYVFAEHPLSDAKLMFKKMKKIMYTMVRKTFSLSVNPSLHVSLGMRPRETTTLWFYLEEKKYFSDHCVNSY